MTKQNTAYELDNNNLIVGIQTKADRNLVSEFIPTSTQEIKELIEIWGIVLLEASTPKEMKPLIAEEIRGYYALLLKKGELARDIFKISAEEYNLKARAQDIKDVEETFPDVEKAKKDYKEHDSKKSLAIVAKDGKDVEPKEKVSVDAETELKDSNDEPMTLRDIGAKFKELIAQDKNEMALSLIDSTLKVAHYIPKKTKQTPRCWEPEELNLWIKKMSKDTIIIGKDETVKTEKVETEEGHTSKIVDKPEPTDVNTAKGLDELRDILSNLFKSEDDEQIKTAHSIIENAFKDSQYDDDLIRKWVELVASGDTEEDHLNILMPKAELDIKEDLPLQEKFDTSDFDVWLTDAVKVLSIAEIKERTEYKSIVKQAEATGFKWDAHAHILSFYREQHPTNDEGEPAATVLEDAENVSTEQETVAKDTKQESSTSDYLQLDELKELIIKESAKLSIDIICSLGPVNKLINQNKSINSFAKYEHLRKHVASVYNAHKQSIVPNEIVYPTTMNEVKLVGTKMIIEDGYGLKGLITWFMKFHKNIEALELPTDEKIAEFVESFFKESLDKVSKSEEKQTKSKNKISIDELKEQVKKFINEGDKQAMGVYYFARSLFRKAGYNTDKMELQEIKDVCDEIIKDTDPEILEKYNQDKEDRKKTKETQITIGDKVFVKQRIADSDPDLWNEVKDITTLRELENKALELCEGEKWQDALNIIIDLITSNVITDAKEMSQEDAINWFSTTVLQSDSIEDDSEIKELDDKYKGEDSEKWNNLKSAHTKGEYKNSIDVILRDFEKGQNINKDIITVIRAGAGKYTEKQGRRKDTELHKFINNRRNNLPNKKD